MKIQITLEDKDSGHVKVVFNPPLERMVKEAFASNAKEFTPAQNYAMVMAHAVRDASKKLDKYDPKRIVTPGGGLF